ncbi:MAG: choice-of-anchor D domain-containing protein, partial [Opitutae bacterium]|nr:choice-of-anchor D domain-containing protein [Opitutae bacterium]
SLGAGLKTTAALSQVVTNATTGYLFITADIAPGATGGNTISINPGVATTDTQFTEGTVTGGTAAGGAQTIITAPAVTTVAASATNTTTATVNGNVTSDGSATITNRGACYKTSASVTIADNKTSTSGTTGAFSVDLSSLAVNQIYYYKAYAQNVVGTTLGSEMNFTTRANTPSAPTVANPTTLSLDITVNVNGNPALTEFAIQRTSDSQYLQADGSWGASAIWATAATWGTKTATGLSSSTEYFFQVKARNSVNVETAFGSTGSGTTSASGCAERWTCLDNLGAPVYTYSLGDDLAYIYYYELNTDTSGWSSDYGLGTTTDGSGWTWRSATYDSNNGSNWKWKNNASAHRFTSVGNWYYAGRFVNGGCTYYADKNWQSTSAKALAAESYFTCSALTAPSSVTAVTNAANSATRVDLGWTRGGDKNVLITVATASPSGSPTQGTAYSASQTFGNQTVVAGSQSGTSLTVTGLTPGQVYYFTLYSENNSYYSTGTTASAVTLSMPRARNTGGSASPGLPAGTIYLGDSAKVFTVETWGVVEANYGAARLWLRAGNSDLSGGTPGALGAYINTDAKSVTSGVFTATGTWYWGIQMDYGSPYSTNFWYKASSAAWANLAANGTGASLSLTVSALNNPSGQTATRDAVNTTSEIDLSWSKNAQSHDVMVLRKLAGAAWTEPTQGSVYTNGNTLGAGTVVYKGALTTASATGLAADSTYDFKFYSVNNHYYSAGVTSAPTATMAAEPGASPNTLTFSGVSQTGMTIGWAGVSTQVLVVVRGTNALSADPTDGTTYSASATYGGGTALGGGYVVYSGTGSSVAISGLTTGTLYYVRVYNFNGGGGATENYRTSDELAGSATTCPGVPTGLYASWTNFTAFTSAWTAVSGATNYYIDVSTNASFSGGASGPATNAEHQGTLGDGTGGTWTESNVAQGGSGASAYIQMSSSSAEVITPTMDLTGVPGAGLTFSGATYGAVSAPRQDITVHVSTNNGSDWILLGSNRPTSSSYTLYDYDLGSYNAAQVKVRFTSPGASGTQFPRLDSILVTSLTSSASTYVPGYSNLAVGAVTSAAVTGLVSDTVYYFRVRSEGTYCVSESSTNGTVTTRAGTAEIALANNGTVGSGTLEQGSAANVLLKFQIGVTVANATLTNLTFTTAGTCDADDLTNLKLRYSADGALDAGDATLATNASPGAAGPQTFAAAAFSQPILVGDTGFFFLTADVAAGATPGNTLSVNALATSNVLFAAGNKTGSASAGGTQTIVASEPTSDATDLSFSSVATNQMTVTWTSGNGGRRIVVVRAGTATSWTPTDGTGPSGVDASYSAATDKGSGNKICYDGTGSSFALSGLAAGTTYAVTVFEYNGTGAYANYYIGGTPLAGSRMTACPAAPTGLFANPTNTYTFTANWAASSGAAGYIIDVSTTNTFGGTGGLTLIDEDFVSFPDWTDNGTSSDTTATHYGAGSPCRALADGSTLISPAVDYPTQLVFYVDASGTGNGKKTTNYYSLDGTTWLPISTFTVTDAGATLVNDLTTSPNLANATNVQFKFVGVTTWYLDDVKVTGGLVGSYVPGYEHLPVSGTSVSVTGLEDSVTYSWRVAATGAECTGEYSVVTNVTTVAGPPPIPTGVDATDGTILEHVQVTWTDANDKEQNFRVWRSASSATNTAAVIATVAANTVSYNDTGAGMGTQYWYWVSASNAMGVSALSVSNSGFRKLPMVQNVQATDGTSVNYSTISWTDSNAGETGYSIWFHTSNASNSATFLAATAANTATYNHAGTPGQQYYYWVRATNSALVAQSELPVTGEPGYRKLAETTVSASDNTDTEKVVVQWTNIAGETGYGIWRSEIDDTDDAVFLSSAAADATSYDDSDAEAGVSYYYWVRGTNSTSGSQGDWSASNVGTRRLVENPASAAVASDGREMVRAQVAANAGAMPVLVLWTNAAVIGTPVKNTTYNPGDTIGNARVVYKGAAADFREHVVPPGATNHYKLFSVDVDGGSTYYSPGLVASGSPVTTKVYQAGVVAETFSYTNVALSADSFTNKGGGAAWSSGSNWVLSTSGDASWLILTNDTATDRGMFFTPASNQATISGNRAFISLDGTSRTGTATRAISNVSTGTIFVSAIMAYRYEGDMEGMGRWLTIALMDGTNEEVEFGKVGGRWRTLDAYRGGSYGGCTYNLNPYHSSTDNWYWVVLKYDFEADTVKLKAFPKSEGIPVTEPADWDLVWNDISIPQVNGIRLKAGSGGTESLGGGLFDEVRVTSIWPALIGQPGIKVSPLSVDFGNTETDRTETVTFWVQNTGGDNVPLTVSSLKLGGTNPTNFSLSASSLSTIYYGQSNSFTATFLPNAIQSFSGTLFITNSSDQSPVTVPLIGAGIASSGTNAPAVDAFVAGTTNQVTDGAVTSGVFSVVVQAYHTLGISAATYDLFNGSGTKILTNKTFESWTSANGKGFTLSNATHAGYWPGTPSDAYKVWTYLTASNGIGSTNKTYGAAVEAQELLETFDNAVQEGTISSYLAGTATNCVLGNWTYAQTRWDQTLTNKAPCTRFGGHLTSPTISDGISAVQFNYKFPYKESGAMNVDVKVNGTVVGTITTTPSGSTVYTFTAANLEFSGDAVLSITNKGTGDDRMAIDNIQITTYGSGSPMVFQVVDDDAAAPVITVPLVNGATTPDGSANGPTIAIGDVPAGGFSIGWQVQDAGSGVYAASNHYTLTRSGAVVSATAVTVGANGDGKASPLVVSNSISRTNMVWGNYVLGVAGHDYDPEWVGDISSASNAYYFVIAAPSIGLAPTALNYGTMAGTGSSNLTVVVTNSGNANLVVSGIGFTGTGNSYFSAAPNPLTVSPGTASNLTVTFAPTAGGTFSVTMTLTNNTPNNPTPTVIINAVCDDPTTAEPAVYAFRAEDDLALTNEVTDHALGHGDVLLGFTLYHSEGMKLAGSSYDLFAPDGTQVRTNGAFDAMTPVTLDGKDCHEFTATVPGFYPAILGVYTARVTAVSVNDITVTDEEFFTPVTAGEGVERGLDDFDRAYEVDTISGWTATITGPTNGNIQVTNNYLQFYGAGGTGGTAGRLSLSRDLSTRYDGVLTNNAGTLTWGFNFQSGQDSMLGFASAQYGAAFVLGCDSTNWVNGFGNGYAVRISSNQVALVRFASGLNANADATNIGTVASIAATTSMAVRVDLDPASGTWKLHVKEWGGNSPDSFGDPLADMDAYLITETVNTNFLGTNNLKYVGCYWNHATAVPANAYRAVFDDVHAPYIMDDSLPSAFTVYDEDTVGPAHSGFNVNSNSFLITSINPNGLAVTGLVADANGVYAGTSNVWTLFSNGTLLATGEMVMAPNTDGAGTTGSPAALTNHIAFSHLNAPGFTGFVFRVVSTDYDQDRPGDTTSATNEYKFYIIDFVDDPTDVTASADGMEMALVGWNKHGAAGVVVLWSTNAAAISGATTLMPGTAYGQGDDGPNGTKVAYHGTYEFGAELVVPEGVSNYFRVFGAAGTTYSSGYADPTNSADTLSYEDGEIADQFAYTNFYTLAQNGLETGQGWSGPWTGDTDKWVVDDTNLLSGATGFPDPYANKLKWIDASTESADSATIVRKLAGGKSGRIFAAFMVNYLYDGTEKYAGLSLMSGAAADTEELFFGKVYDQVNYAGISGPDFAEQTSSFSLNQGHGNDYMIVAEWDPGQKTARLWAYYQGGDPIPQEYTNATPTLAYSNSSLSVAEITGIRLSAGSSATSGKELGHVYFDEVRVGSTWDEVLNFNYPKAYDFVAGVRRADGTNYVSDGELAEAGKAYPISYQLYHRTGVTNAEFTIVTNLASMAGLYPEPVDLALDPGDAALQVRAFTNYVTNRLDPGVVTLGVYTSRVWMTAVSGKATNTVYMEGMAGAHDLFFGEFGEGNNWDKYVEIYNGTGGSIDLSEYKIANQMYGAAYGDGYIPTTNDYLTKGWGNFCKLSATPTNLASGSTIVIVNGEPQNVSSGNLAIMTNALRNATPPRAYLVTTNLALQVGGNDPVALFKGEETNLWIDTCGIAPAGGTGERYIMRRLEDAVVPREHPLIVDTNQWDYRDWDGDRSSSPVFSNFLWTAGEYDRNVGLGGFITFTVYDDDTEAPLMGTNSALMVGTEAPYTPLTKTDGSVEVVLTAWNFYTNNAILDGSVPWSGSLMTNAYVTWIADFTNALVDSGNAGTSENDMFGSFDSPNGGVLNMASIGTYFTNKETSTAWIQFEFNLPSASDINLSFADSGGSSGWSNAVVQWSSDGVAFSTNAAWPPWNPTEGTTAYATRTVGFDGVVTPGLAKVYIRILLGPGYGTAAGFYRMDNVQLTGYPLEFYVTDGQIAASGNKLQFQGNLYDTNSGLDKAQATMMLSSSSATRVSAKDVGDTKTNSSSLWWELTADAAKITDYVNESLSGNGLKIGVSVPDADADRTGDASWLTATLGSLRVIDDDVDRPRMSLETMRPQSSVIVQWACTNKDYMPTKLDGSVVANELRTQSGTAVPKYPTFSNAPTNGYYYMEAYAWQASNKFWLIELVPEVNTAVTNLSFSSYFKQTYGVTHYRIEHWVNGTPNSVFGPYYFASPTNSTLLTSNWYAQSHGWATNQLVLQAGQTNQIRLYGLGASKTNGIGVRWKMWNLTLWQQALSTNGITEVTDKEFSEGSFRLTGNVWDPDSGIASTTNATAAKRPAFSLHTPSGAPFVTDQILAFTGTVADGGAMLEADGAFENSLPQPTYTNVMMGEYTGSVRVVDFDNDRTSDDLTIRADISMYVVDNDIREPGTVGVVRVNGMPAGSADRATAPWTNQPEFIVSFDTVAVDQAADPTNSVKQQGISGIGEYRVTTNDVTSLAPSNRAGYGTPYPVATTNGALANYGFEMTGVGWTLDANCSYQSLATGGTNLVREGTNSLRQVNEGKAYQVIQFRNLAGEAPVVGVDGWYRAESAAGATFRIEAFTTNDLTNAVASSDLALPQTNHWKAFTRAPAAIGNGSVEVLKISLIDGDGNTTYWDDIRLSVNIGTNLPSMRFEATRANQGITTTNYLFAVDADNNRAGDRLAGSHATFVTPYDITPPTGVPTVSASTLNVDDPTTQFDLQWNPAQVGPDLWTHTNHPSYPAGTLAERDLLSPWRTYKIYYGSYTPLESPPADYIYTNFVARANGSKPYTNWPSVVSTNPIFDPSAGGYQPNYLALTNAITNKIRLYGLEFDQDYVVVMVGVDKAGNEGPALNNSWATNNTIKFSMTRGWTMSKPNALEQLGALAPPLSNPRASNVAALAWTASGPVSNGIYTQVTKDYDLIFWDSLNNGRFQETSNNTWNLVGTIKTNWSADDGGHARKRGDIRFYRASYKDRWKRTVMVEGESVVQRPLVSEEVYALHNVVLSGGQNFVGLHGLPYTNTFRGVFGGLETFPGGGTLNPGTGATIIEFFRPGVNAPVSDTYYLGSDDRWRRVPDNWDVTTNQMAANFFNRGFSINLPDPVPASYVTTNATDNLRTNVLLPAMIWTPVMQVPTNTSFSQSISNGQAAVYSGTAEGGRTNIIITPEVRMYNVAALRLPVSVHPSEMNLSGFTGGPKGLSDEIYTMDTRTKGILGGKTIYYDTTMSVGAGQDHLRWKFIDDSPVPPGYFKPNDVIVIVSRNGGLNTGWTWTYYPSQFYTLPNRTRGY